MKKYFLLLCVVSAVAACDKKTAPPPAAPAQNVSVLQTDAQKFGYAVGLQVGKSLKNDDKTLDIVAVNLGMVDAYNGVEPKLNPEQIKAVFVSNQERIKLEREASATKNVDAGKAFMEKNKAEPGVKVTESGLHIQTLQEGTGPQPTGEDMVVVNYRGTLITGEEFDSSYTRKEPATFGLKGIIKGWSESLPLMKTGGKYKLVLPPELAYGEHGAGEKIGPNSTLVFEIELLEVKKAEVAAAKPATGKATPAGKTADKKPAKPPAHP